MREQYSTDGPGKFEGEPPIARFVFERIVLEGFSDDSYSDDSGYWIDRVGRRLLWGDSVGFVYYAKFATVEDAAAAFETDVTETGGQS